MTNSSNIIDTSRLSRRLNVSAETIRRWVTEKKLPEPMRLRPNYFAWFESDLRQVLDQVDAHASAC